jgi:exodeoxyribonuclease VII large subunit
MQIYAVSEITTYLRELLESDLHLADLWVSGEVSNLTRSAAGHLYFTLKDESAQLRCVFFRRPNMGEPLENGHQVVAHGRISLYETRGELQFYVDFVQPEGVGALQMEFERLKARLQEEGLFDEARKRPLPRFPQRIGVATSPTGAVFHDICQILSRRWPLAEVLLAPTAVQGPEAVTGLIEALEGLNREPEVDAIIVARGGGSVEELWAFNEEAVARAIYASQIPVISGVGHETDYTIADYVADVRAPTPSAAAELVAPDRVEVLVRLGVLAATMGGEIRTRVDQGCSTVRVAVERMDRMSPDLSSRRQRVDELTRAGSTAIDGALRSLRERTGGFALQLRSLDPEATLGRGYAVVQRDGRVVTSAREVTAGEQLDVRVRDGDFPVRVEASRGSRRRRVRRTDGRRAKQTPLFPWP